MSECVCEREKERDRFGDRCHLSTPLPMMLTFGIRGGALPIATEDLLQQSHPAARLRDRHELMMEGREEGGMGAEVLINKDAGATHCLGWRRSIGGGKGGRNRRRRGGGHPDLLDEVGDSAWYDCLKLDHLWGLHALQLPATRAAVNP